MAASASTPQRRARDGGPPTTSTSARRHQAVQVGQAGGRVQVERSTLRLPRSHSGAAASERKRSPPGGSTFTTSAPKSASTIVAIPPTGPVVRSTTRMPSNTCGMAGA